MSAPRHILLLCILSALREPSAVNGRAVFAGARGGSGKVQCSLRSAGNFKYFCKGGCEDGKILLKTDGASATNGAYGLSYRAGTGKHAKVGFLTVSIANLNDADAGRYTCALGNDRAALKYSEFEVILMDMLPRTMDDFVQAETEGQNVTIPCHRTNFTRGSKRFLCRGECEKEEDVLIETDEDQATRGRYSVEYREKSSFGLYVTITHLSKADQGGYRCGYGSALSPDWFYSHTLIVVAAPDPAKTTPTWTTFSTSRPSTSTTMPPSPSPSPTTTTHIITSDGFATSPATGPPTTAPSPTTYVRTTVKVTMTTRMATTTTPKVATSPTSPITTNIQTTTMTTTTKSPTTKTTTKKTAKPHVSSNSRSSASSSAPLDAIDSPSGKDGSPLLPLMSLPALGVVLSTVSGLVFLKRRQKARNSKQATKTPGTEMFSI